MGFVNSINTSRSALKLAVVRIIVDYFLNRSFLTSCYLSYTRTVSMLIARFSSRFNIHTQLSQWSTNYRVTIAVRVYPNQISLNNSPYGSHFLNAFSLPTLWSKGQFANKLNEASYWFECSVLRNVIPQRIDLERTHRGVPLVECPLYLILSPKGELLKRTHWGVAFVLVLSFTFSYPPKKNSLKISLRGPTCLSALLTCHRS